MAICASGEISLGGSVIDRSVNLELSRSATSAICMDEADVRTLAARPTGSISMNCFYGKTSVPTTLGQVYKGGYYTGVVNIGGGICYYLSVAPNAGGCVNGCLWKTTRTLTSGTCSETNGFINTSNMENADHPAANWAATRSINGYSDWYLPGISELNIMDNNRASMPAGQSYPYTPCYWSSTERAAACAWVWKFDLGYGFSCNAFKTNVGCRARVIRRTKT